MLRILAFLLALCVSHGALAQNSLLQGGPWAPGRAPMYVGQGSGQAVVQDSGPAGNGGIGLGLAEQLLVVRGNGVAPYANAGSGPLKENWCDWDAPLTNAAGGHVLCISPNAQGGGLISYNAFGTASQLPLYMNLNGINYQFPFALSGIVGPATTAIGDLVIWNNTTGTLVKDSNVLPNGTTATTQALNDNTAKVATDAFVNNALTNPSLVLPNGTTATTQSSSDNSTKVATTAFVQNLLISFCSLSPSGCNLLFGYTDVRWWGAVCDGASNDTTAINNAFAGGASWIWIPAVCNVTALNAPPANVRISGGSKFISTIQTTSATADVLPITNQNNTIDNIGWASTVTRTNGNYLKINASSFTLRNYYMVGAFKGITVGDDISIVHLDDGYIFGTSATGVAIQIGGGGTSGPCGFYLGHTTINATSASTRTNIAVSHLCDGLLEDNQSLSAKNLVINPGNSQEVDSLKVSSTFFDSANGVSVQFVPTGTGRIQRSEFNSSWFNSTNNFNVQFGGSGTSVIDGIKFIGNNFVNGTIGLVLSQSAGTTLKDINVLGNSFSGASTACIYIDGLTSGLITSNIIGTEGGLSACNIGIDFVSPTIGHLDVAHNDVSQSSTTINGVSTITSTGTRITDNPGYNPVGATAAAIMGASPFTIPAGPSPETHYVNQSTTNTATCTQGGQQIAALAVASTYYPIQLGPNESYICTWTTTAPTYTKFVH